MWRMWASRQDLWTKVCRRTTTVNSAHRGGNTCNGYDVVRTTVGWCWHPVDRIVPKGLLVRVVGHHCPFQFCRQMIDTLKKTDHYLFDLRLPRTTRYHPTVRFDLMNQEKSCPLTYFWEQRTKHRLLSMHHAAAQLDYRSIAPHGLLYMKLFIGHDV